MEKGRFTALLNGFRTKHLLVIGDVMLDRFIWGRAHRISPEAPVPIVHVEKEDVWPGGAANVSRNLHSFALKISTLGVIGTDDGGGDLLKSFEEQGLSTDNLIVDPDWETPVKTRIIARNQQIVRFDREKPRSMTSDVAEETRTRFDNLISGVDAVIVSDYGKGFLSQTLADHIGIAAQAHQVPLCVDPNPQSRIRWKGATAIKPNLSEAFRVLGLPEEELMESPLHPRLTELGESLHRTWDCQHLVITLGSQGMALVSRDGDFYHQRVPEREVFDVSGAGDTAIALFAVAYCSGATAREATEISALASSLVVEKIGTSAINAQELIDAV